MPNPTAKFKSDRSILTLALVVSILCNILRLDALLDIENDIKTTIFLQVYNLESEALLQEAMIWRISYRLKSL